jgi:hypothetical protein
MPRRAVDPQESLGDCNSPFSSVCSAHDVSLKSTPGSAPEEIHAHATRVLVHAHRLLAQEAVRQHALEQCIATLHAASPEAYFFFTLDPPILTPAPYKRPGSAKARRLQPRFAAALLQSRTRQATLRLTRLSDRNGTILVAKELVVATRALVRRLIKPSFAGTLCQAFQSLLSSGESASSGRLK